MKVTADPKITIILNVFEARVLLTWMGQFSDYPREPKLAPVNELMDYLAEILQFYHSSDNND